MTVNLNGETRDLLAGDIITVERNVDHSFSSINGAIFEEVSTTHFRNDSFYDDEVVQNNSARKTQLTFWSDWMYTELK